MNKMSKEPIIIEAEDGEDFQDYGYTKTTKKVKRGVQIGVEIYNPRTKEWELKLFNDITFYNRIP